MARQRIHTRINSADNPLRLYIDAFTEDEFEKVASKNDGNRSAAAREIITTFANCNTLADLRVFAKEKDVTIQRVFEIAVERYNK